MPEELDLHAVRMRVALRQAQRAADEGEVPVGAVIFKDGHLIAQALNSPDYTLMEKQRIKTFSRDVFDQLRGLPW